MRRSGFFLLSALGLVLAVQPALAMDADQAASTIAGALNGGQINGFNTAVNTWRSAQDDILGNTKASVRTAVAFARFSASEVARHYRQVPEQCSKIAVKCIDAAEKSIAKDDLQDRMKIGDALLNASRGLLHHGRGGKAAVLQNRAVKELEAVTASKHAPQQALFDLGELYGTLAKRNPHDTEKYLNKAADLYSRVQKTSGDSAGLDYHLGVLKMQLAELASRKLSKKPHNYELKRNEKKAWEAAMKVLDKAYKKSKDDKDIKTAYNQCLWHLLAVSKGHARYKPIMAMHTTKYSAVKLELPDSKIWHVATPDQIKEDLVVFEAEKVVDRKSGFLLIEISRYLWNMTYQDPKSGKKVGGGNISGLARMDQQQVDSLFKNIDRRIPMHRASLRRVGAVETYAVKGLTKWGPYEWQAIFFKSSKVHATYGIEIYGTIGSMEENPFELHAILDSIQMSRR